MPSETEIIIAFLFNRSGKTNISFSDLYLTLSMELNWFTPDDAKIFINKALKDNLLEKKGENIEPAFDIDKIVVPVGFMPSGQILKEKIVVEAKKELDVLDKIIDLIEEKTNLNNKQITEKISSIVEEKNITKEVAALLVGKEYSLTFPDFYKDAEKQIFT